MSRPVVLSYAAGASRIFAGERETWRVVVFFIAGVGIKTPLPSLPLFFAGFWMGQSSQREGP